MWKLLGYRVDLDQNNPSSNRYFVYPPYLPSKDATKLTFRCAKDGEMSLLADGLASTPLAEELAATYLAQRHSIPAFLAALTLRLFDDANPA